MMGEKNLKIFGLESCLRFIKNVENSDVKKKII